MAFGRLFFFLLLGRLTDYSYLCNPKQQSGLYRF